MIYLLAVGLILEIQEWLSVLKKQCNPLHVQDKEENPHYTINWHRHMSVFVMKITQWSEEKEWGAT